MRPLQRIGLNSILPAACVLRGLWLKGAIMEFTLADFERWIAQMAATGYTIKNPEEVDRIRGILKAGGTMSTPVRTYPPV